MQQLSEHLYCFRDTCNVYLLKSGDKAILIDFGNGDILDHIADISVERVTDVLLTHHHRDQGQSLRRAVEMGINLWVPQVEQDLFSNVEAHWQAREIYNNYNVRQDRFSLLDSLPVFGLLVDYETYRFHDLEIFVLPTPGHTVGSVSIITKTDDKKIAFTGDLIAGAGKIWSASALQWTYNGAEGAAASVLSLLDLETKQPDMLLPSHGEIMHEPASAIKALVSNLRTLMDIRGQYQDLEHLRENPYEQITTHLLWNKTCWSYSYVLLSKTGKALLIDFGYDFSVGLPAGFDRASRRPWLYTTDTLKKKHHVKHIDAVVLTHHHDDHVAGLNLLRRVEGAQVWAADNFSDILEHPSQYDIPCLWYDPIPVDRVLPLNQKISWEEYELYLHDLPGHTRYAVAISFTVDGKKILATGDQQGNDEYLWNYVYSNRYSIGDYTRSGEMYLQLRPDVIISGHWPPLEVSEPLLEKWHENGKALDNIHRELLPLETADMDAEGFCARVSPYQSEIKGGCWGSFSVEVRNPSPNKENVNVKLIVPESWDVQPTERLAHLDSKEHAVLFFEVRPPAHLNQRRVRIAADITAGEIRLGQHAEALITVK
jgi:glyoxylase-like metal-dependent hydrolase (beta-lactamase superfamily II)